MFGWKRVALSLVAGAGMLLSFGCGGPSQAQRAMAEKDAQIRNYQTDLATAQEREKTLQEQNSLATKMNQQQAEQLGLIASKNAKLAAATDAKVDALSAQIADLEKKLGSKQQGSGVEVVRGDQINSITIRVANSVLFDVGKADLKSSAHPKLKEVADTLRSKYPENFLRVEGHTDSTPVVVNKGKFADNMSLSQARAKAVFDYLVRDCKMSANRMYTAGYADSQRVVKDERTAEDRSKNRRVDIVILPNIKVEKESLARK
jgi:flagellar motor protein MotB